MSNEAITWAYRQPITTGAKFVLVALADMADEAHSCFPGQARLAKMTGQSERTVRRQLAELELAGYITRKRRFDGAGHRTSDRYMLPVNTDVLAIPTGQDDHRSERPQAKMTGGQRSQRPSRPQANQDSPTGQNDRVSLSEPKTPPNPPQAGGANLIHCDRHSKYRQGCARCVDAVATAKARPPWCGECDEATRHVERDDGTIVGRCPQCHPAARRSA